MKTYFKLIFILSLSSLLFFAGCSKDDDSESFEKQIELPITGLPNEREMLIGGGSFIIPIKLQSHNSWKVEIKDSEWCRILENETQDNSIFKIEVDKNTTSEERIVLFDIIVNTAWGENKTTYRLIQGVAGSSSNGWVEIVTSAPNQLESKLKALPAGFSGIVRLKVTGPLDNNDCKLFENSKNLMPQLSYLDLENASIDKFSDKAFSNNTSITELTIPKSLTSIGKAFYFDSQSQNRIKKIIVPESNKLTYIDDNAFRGCSALRVFDIPKNITYIGSYAFYNCNNLYSEIVIPNNAEEIKSYTFYNSGMHFPNNFKLPETVKKIGERAFYNVDGYSYNEFKFPSGLNEIGEAAFCNSQIKISILPQSLKEISDSTFYECGVVNNLTIPSSVKKIGNHSFQNCSQGNVNWTLNINEGVETIGDFAFANNYYLSGDIVIPKTVLSLGESCFVECNYLKDKLVLNDGLMTIGKKAFYNAKIKGNLYIPKTLTDIGESAFSGSYISGKLVIFSSLKSIGDKAFFNCRQLNGLDFNEATNLNNIGVSAFESCTGLKGDLFLPSQINTVKQKSFMQTGFDGVLTMSNNITIIEKEAFTECLFSTINFSSNLYKLEDYAFRHCKNIKKCKLPSNLKSIGKEVFSGCTSWEGELILPESLENLDDGAFKYCSKLTGKLNFPPKLTQINKGVFAGCGFTGDLIIPDRITYIGDGAFERCKKFDGKLVLGKGMTKINDFAFSSCTFVGELILPDGITSVGQGSFAYSEVTSLIIGKNVKSFGYAAFYGNNLRTVKCYAIIPPITISYNFHITGFDLYVPSGSVGSYKTAEGWKEVSSIYAL